MKKSVFQIKTALKKTSKIIPIFVFRSRITLAYNCIHLN